MPAPSSASASTLKSCLAKPSEKGIEKAASGSQASENLSEMNEVAKEEVPEKVPEQDIWAGLSLFPDDSEQDGLAEETAKQSLVPSCKPHAYTDVFSDKGQVAKKWQERSLLLSDEGRSKRSEDKRETERRWQKVHAENEILWRQEQRNNERKWQDKLLKNEVLWQEHQARCKDERKEWMNWETKLQDRFTERGEKV